MEKKDIIYGTRAVIEAIVSGRGIDKIAIQKGLNNDLIKELTSLARTNDIPLTFVPKEKLNQYSSKNHQGVICFFSAVSFASLENLIEQVFSEGREPFFMILDRLTDVRNFGAIVRTAECAGLDGIIIPDKGSAPITADSMKTSAGALNHLPVCREKDLKKTITLLKNSGVQIVACTEHAEQLLYTVPLAGPIALVMGSEEDGISENLLREADVLAKIPINGKIESLNVSVAAGVAIYETLRQRMNGL
jgi:23S rRNA (guanosine2251-2'-O)-methyltransferase